MIEKTIPLLATVLLTATLSVPLFAQNVPSPAADANKAGDLSKSKNETLGSEGNGAIKNAKVSFTEPKDKAVVSSPVKVKMAVEGMKIRPAGEAPDDVTTGHHHILIDSGAVPSGQPIPNDDKHLHFGKGQTEAEVKLSPGAHTLTLQFADGAHRSYGPKMSQTIHVQVK